MEENLSNQTDEQTLKLVSDVKQYLGLIGPALLCNQTDQSLPLSQFLQRSFEYEETNETISKFVSNVEYSILVVELINEDGKHHANAVICFLTI